MRTHHHGFYSYMLLSIALTSASACSWWDAEQGQVAQAVNPEPDPTTPIGQKWFKLGGKPVVGDAIAEVAALDVANGKYQVFQNGVITYTDTFGALFMPSAIFDRWRVPGAESQLGFPIADAATGAASIAGQSVKHTLVAFERGLIVADASNTAFVLEGVAATEYVRGCAAAEARCQWQTLGNPTDEASPTAGGAFRVQHFTAGAVYYDEDGGAALSGAINDKYAGDPSLAGSLGRPTAGAKDVKNGNGDVIGQMAPFKNAAAIFFSAATGAHVVSAPILPDYVGRFGGPAGWLGFPIGDTGGAAGEEFNDLEHGMLINHVGNDGFAGVNALGQLSFHIVHATITATDGGGGSNETYIRYHVTTTKGVNLQSALCADGGVVRCEDGDVTEANDEDITPNKVIPLGPANSALSISSHLELWDLDDTFNGADDKFGEWNEVADRHNLFGIVAFGVHPVSEAEITFGVQSTHDFDGSDFMGTRWWSFHNWSTDDVTYNQFAQAFDDVGPDESVVFHPFNRFWYEAVIRNIADGGNCAGMAIESIYADRGLSAFPEPVHDFFPNTQDGSKLGDVLTSNAHITLASEINVKHAYQGGADMIRFYIRTLARGQTHDPFGAFVRVSGMLAAGEPVMIGLSTFWFGSGHVVRAYDTAVAQPCTQGGTSPCNRILVADPNFPKVKKFPTYIEIDSNGKFFYDGASGRLSGDSLFGDRMYPIPYVDLLDHQATTPFGLFEAFKFAALLIGGSDGSVEQVTSSTGQTLFKPNLGHLPSTFNDLNDTATGLAEMAPVPLLDSTGSQMLAVTGNGSYTYNLVASSGVAAGRPINVEFLSAYMSAKATIPGTPGLSDQLVAHHINTPDKAISLAINPAGNAKTVQVTLGAPDKYRWIELSNMTLQPGQQLTFHLSNGGFVLTTDNNGPKVTADVRVSAGQGATPVTVGTQDIPPGTSDVQYQLPKTTATLSGEVHGNDGWLLAPVTVELSAKDFSGTGIERIQYRHDSDPWTDFVCPAASTTCSTGPISYAFEGDTTLSYRAIDRAHNAEVVRTQEIKIDTRAPLVATSTDKATYTRVEAFLVHASASDPTPGSGLRTVSTTLDGTPVSDGQSVDLLLFTLGSHSVVVSAEDVAGWQSSASASFQLIATADSIRALITLLRAKGEIDSDGIANSFMVKAEHAQWGALRNEIRAQSGKHISVIAAGILDADVQYVMTH